MPFKFQVSSISFDCSSVLQFYKIAFLVLFSVQSTSVTQAVQVQVSHFHWLSAHMAPYIRSGTVQVRKGSTNSMPPHKHIRKLSL